MTDSLLGVFKICFLILLYLFFARVLWAVWSEVRAPKQRALTPAGSDRRGATPGPATAAPGPGPSDPTAATRNEPPPAMPPVPPVRGKAGVVGRLIIIEPKSAKGRALGVGDELSIGRGDGCTLPIPDDTFVSSLHARFYRSGDQLFVEDLGSTNGTYHNGHRLTAPALVTKGDRVQIGNTVLEAG